MEDAATAEISRSQIWQWIHNEVRLDDGAEITAELVARIEDEELAKIREAIGDEASGGQPVRRRPQAVRAGGARRRLRRLPHHCRVRARSTESDRHADGRRRRLGDAASRPARRPRRVLAARYPGERPGRQPVHTVYVPADRVTPRSARRGARRRRASDARTGARAAALPVRTSRSSTGVEAKLRREPIEDLRIDFEDGYGVPRRRRGGRGASRRPRPALTRGSGRRSSACGSSRWSTATRRRALRTLDLFLVVRLPDAASTITLPKVSGGRPGRGDGRAVRTARAGVRAGGRRAAVRDPDRDAAARCSAPTGRRPSPA